MLSRQRARWVAALSLLLLALAGVIAWHHPITPMAALSLVVVAAGVSWAWRGGWLFILPATLPWLNFAPWTGWLLVDEFDLCMLALLAGAYARQALVPADRDLVLSPDPWATALVALTAASALVGIANGVADAGAWRWGWFDGYVDPLNSLRVGKSLVFAVLMWVPLRKEVARAGGRAAWLLAFGMMFGLVIVAAASLWERLAYTRLLDFGRVYRTTALFWEMHVGGGAIDMYLALAMPFAFWAACRVRSWAARAGASLLLLAVLYACASTFSRGVYGAVLVCLAVMAQMGWRQRRAARGGARRPPPGPMAGPAQSVSSGLSRLWWYAVPVLLVAWLATTALGPRSFMSIRWAQTSDVLDGRWEHWRESMTAMLQGPVQWIVGRGVGRIPAHLQAWGEGALVSGSLRWHPPEQEDGAYVSLHGPTINPDLGGAFALTQRVALPSSRTLVLELEVRVPRRTVLTAEVCERHLLYDRRCRGGGTHVPATGGGWLRLALPLRGAAFMPHAGWLPRLGVLGLSVPEAGGLVEVRALRLRTAERGDLLVNGDFRAGLAHWVGAAQFHFLPWHVDSLYLETLVERGGLGLVALLAMLGLAAMRLWQQPALHLAPVMAASLACAAFVGAVSSVMDAPRVATLFWFLLLFTLAVTGHAPDGPAPQRESTPAGDPGAPEPSSVSPPELAGAQHPGGWLSFCVGKAV